MLFRSGPCVWDGDDLWKDTPSEICVNVDHGVHLLSLVVCGRHQDDWYGQINAGPYTVQTGPRWRFIKNLECARACAVPIAYANSQGQAEGWTAIKGGDNYGYGVPTMVRFESFGAKSAYSEVIFADTYRCGGRGFLDFNHEHGEFIDLYWSNDPEVQ